VGDFDFSHLSHPASQLPAESRRLQTDPRPRPSAA